MKRPMASELVQLLKIRDFALLWSGSTVSLFGDGIYFVAIAWEVYRISNSPTALGVVAAAFSLPQVVLLLVGGVVSDRVDRRTLMIAASLVSGTAIGAIGLVVELHAVALWMIALLVIAYGSSQAFFMPASRALIPTLVPASLLPQAGAVEQFAEPIAASLVGSAVGGAVVALGGTGVAFFIDAATFGVAAAALALIGTRPAARMSAVDGSPKTSVMKDARDAIGFVRSQPWIWAGLIAAALANIALTGPNQVLLPYILKYSLHAGPRDLGLVYAGGGAGSIAAAAYVALRGVPRRNVSWIFISWAIGTLAVAAIGLARAPWQLTVIAFVTGGGIAMGNLIWFTLMSTLVPNQMLGRVSSLDFMISFSLTPMSNAATGPIASVIGAKQTLLGAGLVAGVVTIAFLLVPHVRDPEEQMATTSSGEGERRL